MAFKDIKTAADLQQEAAIQEAAQRRFEALARRTDPERLLAALEAVAELAVKPSLDTLEDPDKAVALFPEWMPGTTWGQSQVDAVAVIAWKDKLYKIIKPHTSQSDWEPDKEPSLYTPYRNPAEGPQPWVQPAGAHDAYPANISVTHNGKTWSNTHGAGNVWEPGVYGWDEL